MKKFLSILLVVLTLISCTATFVMAAGSVSINVSSATAAKGETITVTFSMSGNSESIGFRALQGTITYDKDALKLKSIEKTGILSDAFNSSNGDTVGFLNVGVIKDNGNLFVVTFEVLDGAREKNTVSLVVNSCGNEGGSNIVSSVSSGVVTVPCDHKSLTPVAQVDASCTANGMKAHYMCSCGKLFSDASGTTEVTKDTLKIVATGHKWNSGEVTTKAECDKKGVMTYTCTVKGCGETYTEDIPVTGHTPKAAVKENVIEAGCVTNGSYDSVVYCDVCTKEISREKGIVIPATGHKFGDAIVTKNPTCTEEGEETGTCKSCGETTSQPIAKLGHKYDEGKETTKPTCTESGVKTFTCSVCEEGTVGHSYTESIKPLGHKYDEGKETTKPTCTESGVKTFTCSVCKEGTVGHSYTESIEPLGHKYNDGEMTTEPTCTEHGVMTFTCSVCAEGTDGHLKNEPIKPLGHTVNDFADDNEKTHSGTCSACAMNVVEDHIWTTVIDKEATATNKGSKHDECVICGYEKASVEIPATGSSGGTLDKVPKTGDITMEISLVVLLATLCGVVFFVKRKEVK